MQIDLDKDRKLELKMMDNFKFEDALFDIEHALNIYATSSCTIPAQAIYDKEALAPLMDVIKNCHIYIIGFTPIVNLINIREDSGKLLFLFSILGNEYISESNIPDGCKLSQKDGLFYLNDEKGRKFMPDSYTIQAKLCHETNVVNFEVKYIGQAYGKEGSRNVLDRLLQHETLQEIVIKGVPKGYQITLLLLEINSSSQLITSFNPFAKNKEEGEARINSGITKLFTTSEQELVALYEAALIRYFYPFYNKKFKNSFPSTNLKILQDCYEKDFAGVAAELSFDDNLPFKLFSESVPPANNHIAKHALHDDKARKIFFGL